jgi:hypothetical protein
MDMVFIISKMEVFTVDFGKTIKDMEMEYKFVQTEVKFKVFGKMENLLLDIFCVIDTIFLISYILISSFGLNLMY